MRRLTRRGFLGLTGMTAAGVALSGCGLSPGREGQTGKVLASEVPLPAPFRASLPIPPVKQPISSSADTDTYEIVHQHATADIVPGLRTPIFGYDGIFPGPTIESRSGRRAVVRHVNELAVPTVVHLHGGHTPAESDGYATDLILPRTGWNLHHSGHHGDVRQGEREYVYPMAQRATTLWYHDHRMDFTGPQVWRGLAGFHLIRDDEEDALPLPRGERELPLMIMDRSFAADGSMHYPSLDARLREIPGVEREYIGGVLGDVVLVNGAPWPVVEVSASRYRLRILNGSNARRYRLALEPGAPFVQIGSDGGLLERPVEHDAIGIAPAERFDVIVDFAQFAPGTEVTMVNH